ncbi:MAG: hypothetical protein JWN32_3176 [Solirubrobacterales bacterium]|nr:hypothetical protein [Solirubrobacterales bacterium]
MTRTLTALAAGLTLLLVPAAARAATTFTVDPAAAAGCDASHTCKTIGAATGAAAGGDTISVKPGTYSEAVTIHQNDLTLVGQTSGTAGVKIQPPTDAADAITLSGTGDTVQTVFVAVSGTGGAGIVVSGAGATISGILAGRLQPAGSATPSSKPLIDVKTGPATIKGATLISPFGNGGAVLGEADAGTTISDSAIAASNGSPVKFTKGSAGANVIQRSTISAAAASTVTVESTGAVGLTVDSTVLTGSGGTGTAGLAALSDPAVLGGGTVTIAAHHVTTQGQPYGLLASATATLGVLGGTATVTADNSIVHGSVTPTHTTQCALGCTATATATDHVDTATADSALFVDPAHSNLHLKKGAPVINQGGDTPPAAAKDVDGNSRLIGAKTDLGADEYDDITSITPTLTAAPVTPALNAAVAFTAAVATPDPATSAGVDHYVIAFGDGASATTATGTASHAYAAAGTYSATVVAVGKSGAVSPASTAVKIVVGGGGGGGGGGGVNSSAAPTVKITSPGNGKVLSLTKTVTKTVRRGKKKVKKKVKVANLPVLRGTASDPDGVRSVQVALLFLGSKKSLPTGGTCSSFNGVKSFKSVPCSSATFFSAAITDFNWRYKFASKTKLKKGYYAMFVRATDNLGHASTVFSVAAGTASVFRLK